MASVKSVENQIWKLEGFKVIIKDSNDRDVRSDKKGLQNYDYLRAAKGDYSVSQWKQERFSFGRFDVEVLNGSGETAHGSTKLANVRDSYN